MGTLLGITLFMRRFHRDVDRGHCRIHHARHIEISGTVEKAHQVGARDNRSDEG